MIARNLRSFTKKSRCPLYNMYIHSNSTTDLAFERSSQMVLIICVHAYAWAHKFQTTCVHSIILQRNCRIHVLYRCFDLSVRSGCRSQKAGMNIVCKLRYLYIFYTLFSNCLSSHKNVIFARILLTFQRLHNHNVDARR